MNRGLTFGAGMAAGALLFFILQPVFFSPEIEPVFSPEGGARIPALIDGAKTSIDIEIYVFSSRDVVEALERAKSRGVRIRIIIERNVVGDDNDAIFRELASKGFDIRYASSAYKLTHAKFIIVDGKEVLVGSHNLSNSALYKNREASVIINDGATVRSFMRAFEEDWLLA
ncbi:MAG: phospholipase D-like domain-containing protein [Candidatus Micrarchaeota archaeon]